MESIIIAEHDYLKILGTFDESHATHFSPNIKNTICQVFVKNEDRTKEIILIMTNDGWQLYKSISSLKRNKDNFFKISNIIIDNEIKKVIKSLEIEHMYYVKKYLENDFIDKDSFLKMHMVDFNKHIIRLTQLLSHYTKGISK